MAGLLRYARNDDEWMIRSLDGVTIILKQLLEHIWLNCLHFRKREPLSPRPQAGEGWGRGQLLLPRLSWLLFGAVLAILQVGCETNAAKDKTKITVEPTYYDKTTRTSGGEDWPPWIPGTEGQKEAKVQVLDATTMKPIEGAIVVAGYYGWRGQGGEILCVNAESAVTDAQGWAMLPNDQDERIHDSVPRLFGPMLESAYKRGYRALTYPLFKASYPKEDELKGGWYLYRLNVDAASDERLHNPLYINEQYTTQPERYPDERSALLASKERSAIYLYPSAAKTKEERAKELQWMDGRSCKFGLPFAFSKSEGPLAARKAVYREMLDIGYTEKDLAYGKAMLDSAEKSYQEFRQRSVTGKQK
jgi:hypothetical protein